MLYVFYDTLAKAEGRGSRRVHIISGGSVVLIYNVIWAFFLRQNFVSALICTGKLKSKKLKKNSKESRLFPVLKHKDGLQYSQSMHYR